MWRFVSTRINLETAVKAGENEQIVDTVQDERGKGTN
jgi:hypothetical protein